MIFLRDGAPFSMRLALGVFTLELGCTTIFGLDDDYAVASRGGGEGGAGAAISSGNAASGGVSSSGGDPTPSAGVVGTSGVGGGATTSVVTAASAGSGGGGAPRGGMLAVHGPCDRPSSISLLHDSFDGPGFDPQWQVGSGLVMFAIDAGELLLDIFTTTPGAFSAVRSIDAYDLTDCGVSIKLVELFDRSSQGYVVFGLNGSAGLLEMSKITDHIHVKRRTGSDATQTLRVIPYDATEHAYVRIRETAGTTSWDTSRDGRTWSSAWVEADTFNVAALQVYIGAGTGRATSTARPGTARVDDVNVVP